MVGGYMNTQKIIQEARAKFKRTESKIYLTEKYEPRLTFAFCGGMWTATTELLGFLEGAPPEVVILDNFGNPVQVDTEEFKKRCWENYNTVMAEWLKEYSELSTLR